MANWTNLKAAIAETITTNGNQEITGAVLQNTLNAIVNAVGANATFAGVATPSTNPSVPDGPVFYLAGISGTYSNFGIVVQDEIVVIASSDNGSWTKSTVLGAATTESAGIMSAEDKVKVLSAEASILPLTDNNAVNKFIKELYISKTVLEEKGPVTRIRVSCGVPVNSSFVNAIYIWFNNGTSQTIYYREHSSIEDALNDNGIKYNREGIYALYCPRTQTKIQAGGDCTTIRPLNIEFCPSIKSYIDEVNNNIPQLKTDVNKLKIDVDAHENEIDSLNSLFIEEGNLYTGRYVEGYINSSNGGLQKSSSLPNANCSEPIPVLENKVYCISGRTNSAIRCLDSTQKIKLKVLAPETGTEYSNWYMPNADGTAQTNNGQFRTPIGAKYVQFAVSLYSAMSETVNKIQLNLVGDTYDPNYVPTPFEGFGMNKFIKKEYLPKDIEANNTGGKFSIKDCPLLVISAASHGEGFGSIKDKSFISYFSSLVDYNVENYSLSGSTSFNHCNMLMKDSSIGGVKPSDLGQRGGYVIIVHGGDNESGYFRNGVDGKYFEQNIIHECKAWESLGFRPILSGYWGEQSHPWATIVQSVAKKYGYKYININAANYRFYPNIYAPWWYNAHFGTRTCAMQWHSLLKVLDWMSRPMQSVKIFRPRVAGLSLDSLLFDNEYERLEKWIELSLHHQALQAGKENYVDRLDLYKNEGNSLSSVSSEYAALRTGGSVTIQEKALVRIVLPRVNVDELSIKPIVNGDVSLYARQIRSSVLAIDAGIASAIYTLQSSEGISEGDVLTDSNNAGVAFTVVDVNGNMVTCSASAEFTTEGNMTGTLTTTNGSYPYTHLGKGPGSNYFNQITKNIGQWVEIENTDGVYKISNPSAYSEYDTVDVCLVGSNFTLSDIEVSYSGGREKSMDNEFGKYMLNGDVYKGENILDICNFNNSVVDWNATGDYIQWNGVTDLGDHIPVFYKNKGVTQIVRLNQGAKLSQAVAIKGVSDRHAKTYKVKIVARYYPEEYSNVNSEPSNGITVNSYDIGKLGITIKIGNDSLKANYTDILYVPVTFTEVEKEYTFDMPISSEQILTLEALTDRIELLYCEVFE